MTRIKRFSVLDRISHLFLMLTFLIQAATGFSRLYIATAWGAKLSTLFGGYEGALAVHKTVGLLMIAGFLLHTLYLLTRIEWQKFPKTLFGPDSLVPNIQDFKHLGQRIKWFFGLGPTPQFGRWTYWEKFDYWAVYWGLPLLAITGLMIMYPLQTCRVLPGWSLNVAALLHKAEAILAIAYIFIVHFFIGHLRPSSFPMNEGMFSGSVPLEEAVEEKPGWVAHLREQDKLDHMEATQPATWYRVTYYIFGYAVLVCGIYLLVNVIIYSRYISLH